MGVLSRIRLRAVIVMLAGALLAAPALSRAQVQFPTAGPTPTDPQGVFSRDRATGEEPYATTKYSSDSSSGSGKNISKS